jgi:hypothetical protein
MRTLAPIVLNLVLLAGPASAAPAPVLTVRVESDAVDYAAAVTFVVAFENRGSETVKFFEPLHAGMNTFPSVSFVAEADGSVWRPWDAPFQSMVARGLQGAVIELKPGEKKEYRFVRDRFAPVVAGKRDWTTKRPLPPGT